MCFCFIEGADDSSTARGVIQCAVRIAAVVLAAGRGRRAGGPKALLRMGAATFLETVAALVERPAVDRVVVVLGHDAERVRAETTLRAEVMVVVNESWEHGMLGSVVAGLDAAEADGADAVLLHPVDHPLVEGDTVDRVVDALRAGALVAVPSFGGRRGHPGGFARGAWPALRSAPPTEGARFVLASHPDWIVHVPGGRGCVAGIDTPEDYRRLLGG
jgi:CTP:molybdopterin cytidylyltransferase MocA